MTTEPTPKQTRERVQLHPATDAWMRGDRYGDVIKTDSKGRIHVRLDKSQRLVRCRPEDILETFTVPSARP